MPSYRAFPKKLVDRIRSGRYVDFRDLLSDNISLLQQLETFNSQYPLPALPGSLKPRLRDITSLSSWMYCFLAYVAIHSQDPATQHMLAYGRLIIREALRHSGKGWLDYDRVFRQQAALDSSMQWNTLNTGIQTSTLVGQTGGVSTFCTLCREVDHNASQCALTYLQQTGTVLAQQPFPPRLP